VLSALKISGTPSFPVPITNASSRRAIMVLLADRRCALQFKRQPENFLCTDYSVQFCLLGWWREHHISGVRMKKRFSS